MAPTLTVYEGDSMREVENVSLVVLTKQAADALDALADRMHKRDPLMRAADMLALVLRNRVEDGQSEWLREED